MRSRNEIEQNRAVTVVKRFATGFQGYLTLRGQIASLVVSVDDERFEHVSIAPMDGRTPRWSDMCEVKDIFYRDDEEAVQIHPKKGAYVNIKENCLHLWRDRRHPEFGVDDVEQSAD